MARVRVYEYDAKKLLFPDSVVLRASSQTTSSEIKKKFGSTPLVVKVDQGIKKRGKQGLVAVNMNATQVIAKIREWGDRGFTHFLVEPMIKHDGGEEKYLSFERTRYGWKVLYGEKGGIEVESNWDAVSSHIPIQLQPLCLNLQTKLEQYHIAFLELNPVLVNKQGELRPLDAAALIDDAALGLADLAALGLEPVADRAESEAEKEVARLDDATPASLKFRLINPEGSIWMLLSGGGASLVLADEVADVGLGKELANYGEYSGAPTDDDTYAYAKIVLHQILSTHNSPLSPKALIIAGGVANFTDVASTFRGLIRAMDEKKRELVKAKVKVYVRRGGPNEKKGLAMMKSFLENSNLLGVVYGHKTPLTRVVSAAAEYLHHKVTK